MVPQNPETFCYQRLQDHIYVSKELCKLQAAAFVRKIQNAETILNCIGVLICPGQFKIGTAAIMKLKHDKPQLKPHDNVQLWPSFFSGIEVISNRVTLTHRDTQSAHVHYDFLVSAGRHTGAWLDLPDIQARLLYNPCTVTAICGKILRHGVPYWDDGGERLCIAHYIRDKIHNRLGLGRPEWVTNKPYLEMMDSEFVGRNKWVIDYV